jgi:hypothetical protein
LRSFHIASRRLHHIPVDSPFLEHIAYIPTTTMKILTKEEEAQHYRATLVGGSVAGTIGLAVGFAGVAGASRRYHFM